MRKRREMALFALLSSLPFLGLKKTSPSEEWKLLPPQPAWEKRIRLPQGVDSLGFLSPSFPVGNRESKENEVRSYVTSEKIGPLGMLHSSSASHRFFSEDDLIEVLLSTSQSLQVGTIYTLLGPPHELKQEKRLGYVYRIKGSFRIESEKEGVWVGKIFNPLEPGERGDLIVPALPTVSFVAALPASESQKTLLLKNPDPASSLVDPDQDRFISLGAEDGIQVGMIWRVFYQKDPLHASPLRDRHGLIQADYQVLQVSPHFSLVKVYGFSHDPVGEAVSAYLLTDLNGIGGKSKIQTTVLSDLEEKSVLQKLEEDPPSATLSDQEEKELLQLETWQDPSLQASSSDFPSFPVAESSPSSMEAPVGVSQVPQFAEPPGSNPPASAPIDSSSSPISSALPETSSATSQAIASGPVFGDSVPVAALPTSENSLPEASESPP